MKQKVTIKDVAREAGVSVATVSYVVNNRTDLRISEATRKKVMQIINMLDYTPNQTAKALATNHRNLLAFTSSSNSFIYKRAEQLDMIQYLSKYFRSKNYDLMILPNDFTGKCDSAAAIICYDFSHEMFHMLGDNNFAPLIALDCIIDDPLFFSINTDYQLLKDKAISYFGSEDFTYVTYSSMNDCKNELISNIFSDFVFVDKLSSFDSIKGNNILITDASLYEPLHSGKNIYNVSSMTDLKADAILKSIENAINRVKVEDHQIFI